jgi:nitroreductase
MQPSETSEAPWIETGYDDLNPVERAVSQRRSLRGFRPDPVPMETVRRILHLAARAPSGTNMQPWHGHVLTGAALARFSAAVIAASDAAFRGEGTPPKAEYQYYPKEFQEPYRSRRRKVGWDLYGLIGIGRGEFQRTHDQHNRNYLFFDAPVGLIFTIDRSLEIGRWLDFGMYLENVMILARSHGLETCPQAAFAPYHETIRQVLPIGPEKVVVCGVSLGYADWSRPECALITEREPVDGYVSFHDA